MDMPRVGTTIRVTLTYGSGTREIYEGTVTRTRDDGLGIVELGSGVRVALNDRLGRTVTVEELEPPKPTLPPEPPDGTVVRVGSHVFERVNSDEFAPEHNWYETGVENPSRWEAVCTYGMPELLVAASRLASHLIGRHVTNAIQLAHPCGCRAVYPREARAVSLQVIVDDAINHVCKPGGES